MQPELDIRGYQKPVNFAAQRFSHFSSTYIGYRMQSQAIKQLIMIRKVFPYTVHYQV